MDVIRARYNASRKAWLLLYCWHTLRFVTLDDVSIAHLDENGFRLTITKDNRTADYCHLFQPHERRETLEATLDSILAKQEASCFPPQGGHTITMLIVLALAAIPYHVLPAFLHSSKWVVMQLARSDQVGQTMAAITLALHLLEACYVAYLTQPIMSTFRASLTWILGGFILGYPVTIRAIDLFKIHHASQGKRTL